VVATYGPCETWPARWVCDVSCESPTVTGEAAALATEVIWALSGRQFGLCTVTLRPCRRECADVPWPSGGYTEWAGTSWISPSLISGQWFNVVCGRCTDGCACTALSEVTLPAPVHSIIQVKVDGAIVSGSGYRLDDDRTLVRLGGAEWPTCQELNLADTEVGTWSVTARYGIEPPLGASWAVGELACELIRALNGEDCRLPRNVTQLVRQGVTIQFPNVVELLREGLTGLYLVDQFVATWNPGGLRRRSGTYSVDQPPHRRVDT
jgi:hypothetical protein